MYHLWLPQVRSAQGLSWPRGNTMVLHHQQLLALPFKSRRSSLLFLRMARRLLNHLLLYHICLNAKTNYRSPSQMLAAISKAGGITTDYRSPSDRIGSAYTPSAAGLHKTRCVSLPRTHRRFQQQTTTFRFAQSCDLGVRFGSQRGQARPQCPGAAAPLGQLEARDCERGRPRAGRQGPGAGPGL